MDTHESASTGGNAALIASFSEITSASKEEALFFLESHNWDLDTAVSTFFDNSAVPPAIPPAAAAAAPIPNPLSPDSPSESYSPSHSPSRSRSPSPTSARAPYELRARRAADKQKRPDRVSGSRPRGGIRTFSDLNRSAKSDTDSDEPQEYYTGGQKSGMLVQDPTRGNDVDAIFNEARHAGAVEGPADHLQPSASSKTFTGTARLLSGETISSAPQQHQPEIVTHTITFWRNGFTVDDGPLRRLDDPENAPFLESIRKSECPGELEPADRKTSVHVNLMRRDENYNEPVRKPGSFQGVGRTLGSTSAAPVGSDPTGTSLTTAPLPSLGLVVDESVPSTSIQLRLADGTRMVSRFNYHHTVGDIHAFINASRPGGMRNYQLQMMGFPPKQLNDLNQTIEQAGLASSVVIQKF